MRNILILAAFGLLSSCATRPKAPPAAAQPEKPTTPLLAIKSGLETRWFTREELLKSPKLKSIHVAKDPAYDGKAMSYQGVPLAGLVEGMKFDDRGTLVFVCLDGFSAPISIERVLNTKSTGSIAYVAVEPEGKPWPPVKEGETKTPSPFYLVWEKPERSKIGTDEWPYQLASFEFKPSLGEQFPNTLPDPKLANSSSEVRGYKTFMRTCFACHSMNGQGTSQLGPDLNLPWNPTEYFKPGIIEKIVRNPQDLRHWPQGRMVGFDKTVLSDEEISHVVSYLRHMSKRKITSSPAK